MKWKMITCCKMKQVLKPKDFEKLVDVIRVLEVKREISVQEVMKITQKSRTTAWRYMKTLVEQIQRRMSCSTLKRIITILAIAFSAFMVIGRLISGVHWFTDIVGGVLLSAGLFTVYKAVVMLTIKK